jgi:hypothetical protein
MQPLKLTKGDDVKLLDPESSLIKTLKYEGWMVEGEEEPKRRGRPPKQEEEKADDNAP